MANALTRIVVTAMERQGVSRVELARRLGVSRATVTMNLRKGLSFRIAERYCTALGVKISIRADSPRE